MLWLSLSTRRSLTQLGREYAQNLRIIYTGMLIMRLHYYRIQYIYTDLCLFRQLYEVAIQAAIGNKVIARET